MAAGLAQLYESDGIDSMLGGGSAPPGRPAAQYFVEVRLRDGAGDEAACIVAATAEDVTELGDQTAFVVPNDAKQTLLPAECCGRWRDRARLREIARDCARLREMTC